MVTLVFEAIEPAFSGRIVPAISFAAHRADHAVFLELVPVSYTHLTLPTSDLV